MLVKKLHYNHLGDASVQTVVFITTTAKYGRLSWCSFLLKIHQSNSSSWFSLFNMQRGLLVGHPLLSFWWTTLKVTDMDSREWSPLSWVIFPLVPEQCYSINSLKRINRDDWWWSFDFKSSTTFRLRFVFVLWNTSCNNKHLALTILFPRGRLMLMNANVFGDPFNLLQLMQ